MLAYVSGPMRRLASERAKGVRDRRGGRGKCVENRKKILNSGNEPKNVLKTRELTFSEAKNELGFEGKRTQIKAKKVAKTHLLCGIDRLRKNSFGVSFRGVPIRSGRRGISHCLENTESEIPRGVYPEGAGRDSSRSLS